MRIVVTGARGMLGRDLVASARSRGHEVVELDRDALDVRDAAACQRAVEGADAVVNTAAWTAVDDAESSEEAATAINAGGAENLARASQAHNAVFVHYSTDYVFSGDGTEPWNEAAQRAPINAYGRGKAEGERRVLEVYPRGSIIIRTAWLYGKHGNNFVKTMTRLYREHGTLTVVADQHGQPTWTVDLASQTVHTLESGARAAIVHGTNSGSTTWFGFAQAIVENLGGDVSSVHPTTSEAFTRPARRPANSVLGHDAWATLGLAPMRHWREALDEAMRTTALD